MEHGQDRSDWMLVGRIVGAFGVRGEVKVELHTDDPERFSALRFVFLGPDHAEREILGARVHKGQALLTLAGVGTPEAAARLRGTELWVPRDQAISLPDGHYFLDDLLGVRVLTDSGREVGTVTDVLRTGSNDVYVVGHGQSEVLIPGTRDAVQRLDLEERVMVVAEWVLAQE